MKHLVSLFIFLFVFQAEAIPKYSRTQWKHWTDADRDGLSTRDEVLRDESIRPVVIRQRGGKRYVAIGVWVCPYTGKVITDPKKLDIDHLVALGEAHRSGGWRWGAIKREKYANDLSYPDHLVAVEASANRKKSDKDPALWMPENKACWCWYVNAWLSAKARWKLETDEAEQSKINEVLAGCKGVENGD